MRLSAGRLVLGLLVVYLLLTLIGVDRYPAVWIDEGWISEPAWALSEGLPLGNPSHGEIHRFNDRLYWMPPLHFLLLAPVVKLGIPPLVAGRGLSMVAGGATLALLLILGLGLIRRARGGRSQADPPTGLPTGLILLWLALVFTLDPTLWKVHRTVRFEALLGLWTLGTLAAAWGAPRRWRAPLVGLLAALAVLTHPNGILAAAAGGGVLLLTAPRVGVAVRDLGRALVVGTLAVAPWLLYLAGDRGQEFANFMGQNLPHFHGREHPLFEQILLERSRYQAYFPWPWLGLPLVLWGATLAAALARRAPRSLLLPFAVLVGGLACLPNKTEFYLTMVAPLLYLLAVWVLARAGRARWLLMLVAGLWVANLAAADAGLLKRNRGCDYDAWLAPITRALPAEAAVAGTFRVWFPLRDHRFHEIGRIKAGDLADRGVNYVVWETGTAAAADSLRLTAELGSLLQTYGEARARSEAPCYGTAILYQLDWSRVPDATLRSLTRYGDHP